MRPNHAKHLRDVRLAGLAARQHGVVTRAQLAVLGLDNAAIRRRKEKGRLHQLYRNVYAVGHTDIGCRGRFLAAVLAYGNRAVLSHRAAAAMWGIVQQHGERIDVRAAAHGRREGR